MMPTIHKFVYPDEGHIVTASVIYDEKCLRGGRCLKLSTDGKWRDGGGGGGEGA